jgi:hypothetical protein
MLKQANEQVGRAFAQVARWLGQAGQAAAPVARRVLGQWAPPAWAQAAGRGLGRLGGLLQAHALLTLVVAALAGAAVWQAPHIAQRWRAWAPAWMNLGLLGDDMGAATVTVQLQPPGAPDYRNNGGPQPLVVSFSAPAAPPLRIGKEPTDVSLSPEVAGQWKWVDASTLRFEPQGHWPIGEHYTLKLGRKSLAPHVALKERKYEFDAAGFTMNVGSAEFYQDPVQAGLRRVVMTLDFNHPVDAKALESRIHLDDGSERKFSVSYDAQRLQATVQSEPLAIPAQTVAMQITIDKGVGAQRGGPGTPAPVVKSVDVPGLYSLAISEISTAVVSNDAGDPEHVLHVGASMAVHEREYARTVQAWMLPVSDRTAASPSPGATRPR